eukprot:281426-Rhodomonas_salina.1
MSGTGIAGAAVGLRAPYAISSTDIAYAAADLCLLRRRFASIYGCDAAIYGGRLCSHAAIPGA